MRRLKGAARLIHDLGDQKLSSMMIVPAQTVAHHVERHDPDANAMARAQMFGDGKEGFMPDERQIGSERFGRLIELRKIIARLMQEGTDTIDRAFMQARLGAIGIAADDKAFLIGFASAI